MDPQSLRISLVSMIAALREEARLPLRTVQWTWTPWSLAYRKKEEQLVSQIARKWHLSLLGAVVTATLLLAVMLACGSAAQSDPQRASPNTMSEPQQTDETPTRTPEPTPTPTPD